jgi:aminopeptidase N
LFYQELRQRLGDDAFFEFLQNFYQANRYGVVNSVEFQNSAEESCGCRLDELFDLWVFEGGELALP